MASIVCKSPGKAIVMIGLTSKGRNLLKNASKAVQMTAMGSFTPPGSTRPRSFASSGSGQQGLASLAALAARFKPSLLQKTS